MFYNIFIFSFYLILFIYLKFVKSFKFCTLTKFLLLLFRYFHKNFKFYMIGYYLIEVVRKIPIYGCIHFEL